MLRHKDCVSGSTQAFPTASIDGRVLALRSRAVEHTSKGVTQEDGDSQIALASGKIAGRTELLAAVRGL